MGRIKRISPNDHKPLEGRFRVYRKVSMLFARLAVLFLLVALVFVPIPFDEHWFIAFIFGFLCLLAGNLGLSFYSLSQGKVNRFDKVYFWNKSFLRWRFWDWRNHDDGGFGGFGPY